jgi:hypothetical protein
VQRITSVIFSAPRALRLLGFVLDAIVACGILIVLSSDIGWRAITDKLCATAVLALVVCWPAFIAVHVVQLFTARTQAVSGLWRAVVYFLVFVCARLLLNPTVV